MSVVRKIRWMIQRDLEDVLRIDWASFEDSCQADELIRCLRPPNCIGMVAEDGTGRIVGFMLYELFRSQIHLLKIAVSPLERRQGVGREMLKALSDKLVPRQRNRVQLKIRETNIAAQLFFRRQGYRCVATLKNSFQNTADDAYVMQYQQHEAVLVKRSLDAAGRRSVELGSTAAS